MKNNSVCTRMLSVVFFIISFIGQLLGQVQSDIVLDPLVEIDYGDTVMISSVKKNNLGMSQTLVCFSQGPSLYSYFANQSPKLDAFWQMLSSDKNPKSKGAILSGDQIVFQSMDNKEFLSLSDSSVPRLITQKERPAELVFYVVALADFSLAFLNDIISEKIAQKKDRIIIKSTDQKSDAATFFMLARKNNKLFVLGIDGTQLVITEITNTYASGASINEATLNACKNKQENYWCINGIMPRMIMFGDTVFLDSQVSGQHLSSQLVDNQKQVITTDTMLLDNSLWQIVPTVGLSNTMTLAGQTIRVRYGSTLSNSCMLRNKETGTYLYADPQSGFLSAKALVFDQVSKKYVNQQYYEWTLDDMITNQVQTYFKTKIQIRLVNKGTRNILCLQPSTGKAGELPQLALISPSGTLTGSNWKVQGMLVTQVINPKSVVYVRHLLTGDYLTCNSDGTMVFDQKSKRMSFIVDRAKDSLVAQSGPLVTDDALVLIDKEKNRVLYATQENYSAGASLVEQSPTLAQGNASWTLKLGRQPGVFLYELQPLRLMHKSSLAPFFMVKDLQTPTQVQLFSTQDIYTNFRGATDNALLIFELVTSDEQTVVAPTNQLSGQSSSSTPSADKPSVTPQPPNQDQPKSPAASSPAQPVSLEEQFIQESSIFQDKKSISEKIDYVFSLLPKYKDTTSVDVKRYCASFIYKLSLYMGDMSQKEKDWYLNLIRVTLNAYKLVNKQDYDFISSQIMSKLVPAQ